MRFKKFIAVISIPAAIVIAGSEPWKEKAISEWTEDDARIVLSDSPWVKTVQVQADRSAGQSHPASRGMGRRGGINLGGIGVGLPGAGGMGRRGGGYPGGGYPTGQPGGANTRLPSVRLRWESALPVRSVELKARDMDAPTVDEGQYAIAVYAVPERFLPGGSNTAGQLKKQAALKRDGKPDIKPSAVEVLQRSDGAAVVYFFPRSAEIAGRDKHVEFDGRVGVLRVTQSFQLEDMVYQGKLEL